MEGPQLRTLEKLFYNAIKFDILEFSHINIYKSITTDMIFYCEKLNYVESSHPRCAIEKLF